MENNFNISKIYKRTIGIAIPIMIQNLITNFVALIDNMMVGQIGTEQMSGVAIVNQLLFVFNLTLFGAVSGAGIFSTQFFGSNNHKGVRDTMRFKILSASALFLVSITIFLTFGDSLITMYLHDADKGIDLNATFMYAKQYLGVMLIGLLPFAFENAYSGTLREGGNSKVPMLAGIIAVIINTVLNYFLIFGIGFFPELGVVGAAIATVISRFAQIAIVMFWTHSRSANQEFAKGLYRSFKIPAQLVKKMILKGLLPLSSNEFLWSAGVAVLAQCWSMRGIDVVAGYNISSTVVNLFNVMFISFGSGVAVVIGQFLGAKEFKSAKKSAPRLIGMSALICVLVGAIMAMLAGLFPKMYNTTDEVRALATSFILISALTMPIHGMLHSSYFILRSGGKTLITFLFDSGFSWLVSVPLAFCLVRFTNVTAVTAFFICQMAELIKCVIGFILIQKGVWLSNIISD